MVQVDVDAGGRPVLTGEEHAGIKPLRAVVRRREKVDEILRAVTVLFAGGTRPPTPLIMAFVVEQAAQGRRGEPIGRVLREQGCQGATRTDRSGRPRRGRSRRAPSPKPE